MHTEREREIAERNGETQMRANCQKKKKTVLLGQYKNNYGNCAKKINTYTLRQYTNWMSKLAMNSLINYACNQSTKKKKIFFFV